MEGLFKKNEKTEELKLRSDIMIRCSRLDVRVFDVHLAKQLGAHEVKPIRKERHIAIAPATLASDV